METLKQQVERLKLGAEVLAKVSMPVKSNSWYVMDVAIINNANKVEHLTVRCNVGTNKPEYIAKADEFFSTFKPQDCIVSNIELREKGQSWIDEASGATGVYSDSYLVIDFYTRIRPIGENAILADKELEFKLNQMARQSALSEVD